MSSPKAAKRRRLKERKKQQQSQPRGILHLQELHRIKRLMEAAQ